MNTISGNNFGDDPRAGTGSGFAGPGSGTLAWHPRTGVAWGGGRCWILGIINATPDSFSDGGAVQSAEAAVLVAQRMVKAGADGVDIGGESTRPGALPVDAAEQVRRVVPLIAAIRQALPELVISIDTTRAAVAAEAIRAGADVINDVSGGGDDPEMLPLAAQRGAGLILMHRLRPPRQDVASTQYGAASPPPVAGDVVVEVRSALAGMLARAIGAGVAPQRILLDPGLGFGKTVRQNAELMERSAELLALGRPLLSGLSRKSFVGAMSGLPGSGDPKDRLAGTVALSVMHALRGASVFRVHDVGPCREALNVLANVALASGPSAGSALGAAGR